MKKHFLIFIFCIIGSIALQSQSIYYNYRQDDFLRLELNKPFFSSSSSFYDIGFLSFDAYLNGEFKVGQKNKIAFELPYNLLSLETWNDSYSSSNIGNIALAYQIRDLVSPNYLEFKLRLPTAKRGDTFEPSFLMADYTERFASLVPDLFGIEASYSLESGSIEGFYYRFKPGLQCLFPIENSFDDSFELLLDLNVLGGYRNQNIDFNAGITTTSIITESDMHINERVLRQFFTTFTYNARPVKPGFMFRVLLDESVGNLFEIVLGVHVGYTFGSKVPVKDLTK